MNRPLNLLSIVIPVFNEEEVLPLLLARLVALVGRMPCQVECLFINDGSRDRTIEGLEEAAHQHSWVRVIDFSRNFGHQVAITAGTDFAQGDAVVIMDADLQDPPEVILEMIAKYREGFDVVYGQRIARLGESTFKRWTAAAFYGLMKSMIHKELPENTGDFRLMSRPVVQALRELREQHRFVRGMVTWTGFRQTAVPFERPGRAAGTTKYPTRKMMEFAWRAITSFSGLPLRLAIIFGLLMLVASFLYALFAAYGAIVLQNTVRGWTSLVFIQIGLSGVTLLMLGLIGDYVARIYEEIKGRPLYIVQRLLNADTAWRNQPPRRVSVWAGDDPADQPFPTTPADSTVEPHTAPPLIHTPESGSPILLAENAAGHEPGVNR